MFPQHLSSFNCFLVFRLFGEICTRMQITNQEKILTDKFFKPPCKQGAAALYKVQTRLIFMAQVVCLFYLQ